ncbi:MAG: hypothetical protein ACJ8AD_04235, partial [Gemmatimonadaceae bacterium]
MPHRRLSRLVTSAHITCILTLVGLGACERRPPSPHADSVGPGAAPAADSAAARRRTNGWNVVAGPALLVQGPTREQAVVLLPSANDSDAVAQLDSASLSAAPVILLGRGGTRYSAQLGDPPSDDTEDCERWPLRSITGKPADGAWSVGFVSGRVVGLPLDSVDVLSAR